jgi:hypothetical protein
MVRHVRILHIRIMHIRVMHVMIWNVRNMHVSVGIPLNIQLAFDETYHLPYVVQVDQDTAFGRAFPPHFRRNVYILAIGDQDPVTLDETLTAFNSNQSANTVALVDVWLVKRNSNVRTDLEEQQMMFDQVCCVPVALPAISDSVACRAVASLYKPDCLEHIGQMMKIPFKSEFKGAHFENYDNMYHTGTWSYPVVSSLVLRAAVLLPIHPAYTVKSIYT